MHCGYRYSLSIPEIYGLRLTKITLHPTDPNDYLQCIEGRIFVQGGSFLEDRVVHYVNLLFCTGFFSRQ
jgi:hypothetical protein